MEGMEEELRLPIQSRRDGCVAWRRPLTRRPEQGFALLGVWPERVIGYGDPDAVRGCGEVVAGVEQPVAAVLTCHERTFDEMTFPVEVVGQHNLVLAD